MPDNETSIMQVNNPSSPLKLLLAILLVLLGGDALAQQNNLPKLKKGRMNWESYGKLAPQRMNQKDYAMYMVRVNGLYKWFETEPDQSWIDDFHFFDVNGDRIPDGVYTGATKYYKGDQTMLMFGDSSLKYPMKFSEPGYVNLFIPSDSGIDLTLVREPSGTEYRVFVRQYFYSYAADSARQLWESQYISTTEIPSYLHDHEAFEVQLPTYLRTSPEVLNEPGIDYDQDGSVDGLGNVVADLKPGQPMFRLWQESKNGQNWSFVMLMQAPEGKHLFKIPSNDKVPTAYCGWILSEAIGQ